MGKYQAILFYANDNISRDILKMLSDNPHLANQMKCFCVMNPTLHVPEIVRKTNRYPAIIASGFNNPIVGHDALAWIKNTVSRKNDQIDHLKWSINTFSTSNDAVFSV